MNRWTALLLALFAAHATAGEISPKYGSVLPWAPLLAAPEYITFTNGYVPQGAELDMRRADVSMWNDGTTAVNRSNIYLTGGFGGNAYDHIAYILNGSAGMATNDSQRCEYVGSYPWAGCIAHKTAVANFGGGDPYFTRGHAYYIGPGVGMVRTIEGFAGGSTGIVEQTTASVDVKDAVYQWNVSPNSTGDFVRILGPDGERLRITKEGRIYIRGVSIEQYVRSQAP